jgi:hypothetical protein
LDPREGFETLKKLSADRHNKLQPVKKPVFSESFYRRPSMSEEKKDFVIKDRRIFAEGSQDQKEKAPEQKPPKEEAEERVSKDKGAFESEEKISQLPEINFATFIFSLNSSALVQLGIIEDPATGTKMKNLSIAKQTIDILAMLEEKTRGNLTKEEDNLLKMILYDLRLMYVKEKG